MTVSLPEAEAVLRSLFPVGVAVAAEHVGHGDATRLWPEERQAVVGAVPRRLAEFTSGRIAARRVLATLGLPPAALPVAPDRAAIWPAGISGSIAHSEDLAVAVARHGDPVGVDVEPDAPLEAELWPIICSDAELARLTADTGRLARRVFAAKEAVFKAQPSHSRAMFGFDAVSVTLAESAFHAQFQIDVGAFRAGQILSGGFATVGGLIFAGLAW